MSINQVEFINILQKESPTRCKCPPCDRERQAGEAEAFPIMPPERLDREICLCPQCRQEHLLPPEPGLWMAHDNPPPDEPKPVKFREFL